MSRIHRKLSEILRYPALAYRSQDWRDLSVLGLWRNRLLGAGTARLLTRKGDFVITPRLTSTHGQPVRLTLGDYSELDSFDELFIDEIYRLTDVPFAPDLVVDCGAYHGYFCALARGSFKQARMVCFEPNPEHQEALASQLALLSGPVEIEEAAIGLKEEISSFLGHDMGGTLVPSSSSDVSAVKVRVIDFPRWLVAQTSKALVLKMDVEGLEREILPSILCYLPARTALFLETHYPETFCQEILAPYGKAGFSMKKIRRRHMNGQTYIEWFLYRD